MSDNTKKTMKRVFVVLFILGMLLVWSLELSAQVTKLKEFVKIQGAEDKELIGYGLVTGLDRTGDRTIRRQGATFTVQSIANMLQNFGVNIDPDFLRTRNVAAVMVTARLSPFQHPGSQIDVTVSSLGDAASLVGGVLLQTPLMDPDNPEVFVKAQGSLTVGGILAETQGARIQKNMTTTGLVPNGGTVVKNDLFQFDKRRPLGLILRKPSLSDAEQIAIKINEFTGEESAGVFNAGMVQVAWPDVLETQAELNGFVAAILDLEVNFETPARVVINERTGTIVAGGNVRISEVMVSHGNITVMTVQAPFVSQPAPLSLGSTQRANVPTVAIDEQKGKTFPVPANTTVEELAKNLNKLGLTPRDIISIFQAIDRAGALKGELVVM
jgi:flagellar P-ring protein precursor FlgI